MPSSQEPSNSNNNAENKKNKYRPQNARWVIYYYNNNSTDIAVIATNQSGPFLVSSFDKRLWLASGGRLVSSRAGAAPVDILFFAGNRDGEKRGYSISYPSRGSGDDNTGSDPGYINVDGVGNIFVGEKRELFNVVSVTYYD